MTQPRGGGGKLLSLKTKKGEKKTKENEMQNNKILLSSVARRTLYGSLTDGATCSFPKSKFGDVMTVSLDNKSCDTKPLVWTPFPSSSVSLLTRKRPHLLSFDSNDEYINDTQEDNLKRPCLTFNELNNKTISNDFKTDINTSNNFTEKTTEKSSISHERLSPSNERSSPSNKRLSPSNKGLSPSNERSYSNNERSTVEVIDIESDNEFDELCQYIDLTNYEN